MPEAAPEPIVSRNEMREALARGGTRPNRRVPLASAPAWDWQTPDETDALREEIARLEAELDAERLEIRRARARETDLHGHLRALAVARPWARRRMLADLRERRVL